MLGINYLVLIVVTVVAFVASFVWYMFFGKELVKLNPKAYGNAARPGPKTMLVELARNVILALVIFYLTSHLHIVTFSSSILLAVLLWIGFPIILLSGSVQHEKVPVKLAAIHAGDWLIKLLVMVIILSLWH